MTWYIHGVAVGIILIRAQQSQKHDDYYVYIGMLLGWGGALFIHYFTGWLWS